MLNPSLSIFHTIAQSFYSNILKRPLTYLGIESTVKEIYLSMMLPVSNDKVEMHLGTTRVEFLTIEGWFQSPLTHNFSTELPVMEDFLENIRPRDVVYDVGGNMGTYSCLAGKKVSEVITFEPDPFHQKLLSQNLKLNGIDATVLDYALSDSTGASKWLRENNPSSNAIPGDVLIDKLSLPIPNVLKIDIEGGELAAIRGLEQTIHKPECRLIYCELHPAVEGKRENHGLRTYEVNELYSLLEAAGFSVEEIHIREEHADQPFLKAQKE